MIERFEILKDGGSSIYGSDAVAGAINVITRQNFEGAALSSNANMTFDGGGETFQLDGIWGTTFDRGHLTIAAEYYKRLELKFGDRDYLNCAQDLVTDATGRSGGGIGSTLDIIDPKTGQSQCLNTFEGALIRQTGGVYYNVPGAVAGTGIGGLDLPGLHRIGTSWNRLARTAIGGFAPATCFFPFTHACTSEEQFAAMTPVQRAAVEAAWRTSQAELDQNDPRNLTSTLISPVQRGSIFLQGAYDVFGGGEAYTEMLYTRREFEQNGFQQLFPVLQVGPSSESIYWIASRPGSTRHSCKKRPIARGGLFRGVWGLRGELGSKLGVFSGWSYDIYAQWSRSDATYETDFMYNDRVSATTENFALPCDPALITISSPPPSCPTILWTTTAILEGQFSAEQAAFLFGREAGKSIYDQTLVNGVITGDVMTLPAGALSAAIGFEFRTDEIDDTPGPMAQASNYWGLTTADRTAGTDEVHELFAEFSLPVLANKPYVDSLTIDMSGRYTDYRSYGEGSVYKIGANWQITPEYRLRGTTGTSFRAPALYEIFLGNQTGFLSSFQIDPCIQWDQSSDPRITDSCGPGPTGVGGLNLPPGWGGSASGTLIVSGGGGPGVLKAETSEFQTLGFIWTPDWINFLAALDYWRIEIFEEVSQLGSFNIVFLCHTRTPLLANGFCDLVDRETNQLSPDFGQIYQIDNRYRNLPNELAEGLDLHTRFTHEFPFGKLLIESDMTWMFKAEIDVIGDGADTYNGEVYSPDFIGNITAHFDYQDYTFTWHTEMAGKASDNENVGTNIFLFNGSPFEGDYKHHTEFASTHDASVRYRAADWEIIAGVQNVFDDPPPTASSAGFANVFPRAGNAVAFGGPYDILGRRAFLTVTKEF